MEYKDFVDDYRKQLQLTSHSRRLDLALAVCKRLFFDYVKFAECQKWRNEDLLFDAINFIENSKSTQFDQEKGKNFLSEIERIAPDTDDFDNASYALNACVAVIDTIEYLLDPDPRHILNVGICLIDTVDFKIQEEVNLTEIEISTHPEMIEAQQFLIAGSN